MRATFDRRLYDTETATLIADGRNCFLYRTPKRSYFCLHKTLWQGECNRLEPLSLQEAIDLYEGPLREHAMEFEDAFPGVPVKWCRTWRHRRGF